MSKNQKYTVNDLLQCLEVLKTHKELTAQEWAKKMGIDDIYDFTYLRKKTISYFKNFIQIEGKKRGTRYKYIESTKKEIQLPKRKKSQIKKEIQLLKGKNSKVTIISSWKELKNLIEATGCNFKGNCNLKKINSIYCSFCSHQIKIPIPETIRSNRTILKLESQLSYLKINEIKGEID